MATTIGFGDFLYGYAKGERIPISNNVEQICAFIMKHRLDSVKIVSILDELEIETSMGFLMYCRNQEFLQSDLLPSLVPMQQGEVTAPEFIPYVDENFIIRNVRLEGENGEGFYLVDLNFFDGYPEPTRTSSFFKTEEELIAQYPNSINTDKSYEIAMEREIL